VSVIFVDATGEASQPPQGAQARPLNDLLSSGFSDGDALVVYAPPPGWDGEARLIELIQTSGVRAVLVRAEGSDGFTPDPLAAACTGLIAGFGKAGIAEAVTFLSPKR
jgi:hypothetical protein